MGAVNPYDEIFKSLGNQKPSPYDDAFSAAYQAAVPAQKVGLGVGPRPQEQPNDPGALMAAIIGAGATGERVKQGVSQLFTNAKIVAKQVTGLGDSSEDFRKLARQRAEVQANDAEYQKLRQMRPFMTGLGEGLPSLAVPMGQATAMGRILAPAAGMAAMGAIGYGSPEERLLNAGAQGAMGLAGGALGEGVRALVAPTKSALTAGQQEALRSAAQNIGIKPRVSELTGSPFIRSVEDNLAQSVGSAGVMRRFADANNDAIAQRAASAIGVQTQTGKGLTADVLRQSISDNRATRNALGAQLQMPVTSTVTDAVDKGIGNLSKGASAGKGEALSTLSQLKDDLLSRKSLDGADFQRWVSDIKSVARGSQNDTAARELRSVVDVLQQEGQGAARPLWQDADRKMAMAKTLMKPGVVDEVSGTVNPKALYNRLQTDFGETLKQGNLQGPLVDIANYGKALPPLREGSQTFQRGQVESLAGLLQAAPKYVAAKALTSDFMRDYLTRGLLADPAVSNAVAPWLARGALPLGVPALSGLLSFQ